MPTTWKQERKNLGVHTDTAIAERLGVTKERVRQVRNELKIPRASRPLRRPDRGVGTNKSIVKCLYAVPLSTTDRQRLTDARILRGWSQTELANRIDSSLTFIHAIETGKKSPSPDYLNRLCKALGLEWHCEFRVQIDPKPHSSTRRSRR